MNDPYTMVTVSIGNEDDAVTKLHENRGINFPVAPSFHCQLELFYDAISYEWRYVLYDNLEGYNELCRGTLTNEKFEAIFSEIQSYGDITTQEERELNTILDRLTDVIQDDYTMIIKAESAIHQLVQEGLIQARTADSLIGALGSRKEY